MTATVSQITPDASAGASPKGADCEVLLHQTSEQEMSQAVTRSTGITDEQREAAIKKSGELLEVFMAEHELYEALWSQYGDFTHKAESDKAFSHAQWAMRSMRHLIANRSPEMVARLERERGLDTPACANEEMGE